MVSGNAASSEQNITKNLMGYWRHGPQIYQMNRQINCFQNMCDMLGQGGITCGAIDEPRKSSKAIDERVIIKGVNLHFRVKNDVFDFYDTMS